MVLILSARIFTAFTRSVGDTNAHLHKLCRLQFVIRIEPERSLIYVVVIINSSLSHSNNVIRWIFFFIFSICINHSLRAPNSKYRLHKWFLVVVVWHIIYFISIYYAMLFSLFSILFRFSLFTYLDFCYFV